MWGREQKVGTAASQPWGAFFGATYSIRGLHTAAGASAPCNQRAVHPRRTFYSYRESLVHYPDGFRDEGLPRLLRQHCTQIQHGITISSQRAACPGCRQRWKARNAHQRDSGRWPQYVQPGRHRGTEGIAAPRLVIVKLRLTLSQPGWLQGSQLISLEITPQHPSYNHFAWPMMHECQQCIIRSTCPELSAFLQTRHSTTNFGGERPALLQR